MTAERKRIKGASGQHASVKAFREKMESIRDHQLEDLRDLNARLDPLLAKESARAKSDNPPADEIVTPIIHDPRREPPDDPRREPSLPPIDIIVEGDPFPSKKKKKD